MIIDTTFYRDRLRILLIIYFFSDRLPDIESKQGIEVIRLFKSEIRLQKIDFLIRYPDYLSYELLKLLNEKDNIDRATIKEIVKEIFGSNEPKLRKQDMTRYLYGAYENIDNIIAFLVSRNFIFFESKRRINGTEYDKYYYITLNGFQKIKEDIILDKNKKLNSVNWYINKCEIIKEYFGDLSGTELRIRQYDYEEYSSTKINNYIQGITNKVCDLFLAEFGEDL